MKNLIFFAAALVAAPFFIGVINQTKAFFAGRRGSGFFRLYFDLAKLLRKSSPRSVTATWLFDLAPSITLAATIAAAMVFPWMDDPADKITGFLSASVSAALFFYLLGAGRFFTVLGALDTGSAFEGMGASREVQFSALVEPIVFVVLGFLVLLTDSTSLPGMLGGYSTGEWTHHSVSLVLAAIAFFAILLSETCRVPFDDPETHLELTMIHEAMILDNAGVDLAYIHYGAALKFELLAAFLVAMILPDFGGDARVHAATLFGGILAVAIATGVVESTMARMRFFKTPQILLAALMTAMLSILLFLI